MTTDDLRAWHERDYDLIKVSVARCARVSYKSFETGKMSTPAEDLALYDKLLAQQPIHASPAEHQATPCGYDITMGYTHADQMGNFTGWRQYRKMLPGEACAPLPAEYRVTEEGVFAALERAVEGGYRDLLTSAPEYVATDLGSYSADYEGVDVALLVLHVRAWQRSKGY